MSELSEFQREVGDWGRETFNHDDLSLYSLWHHLQKEVKELAAAIADFGGQALDNISCFFENIKPLNRSRMGDELADCFILLLNIAHLSGIDLFDEARKKMGINRGRDWPDILDKDGVFEHIKPKEKPYSNIGWCSAKEHRKIMESGDDL